MTGPRSSSTCPDCGVNGDYTLVDPESDTHECHRCRRQWCPEGVVVELCRVPSPDGVNACEFVKGHTGGHGVWVAE